MYTNDDLSRLPNNSISVVGHETPSRTAPTAATELRQKPESDAAVKSAATGEEYWRGRARELQVKMSALDATIARVQENIANAAGHGYDIHTDILDLSLPDLLEEKADLQKQAALLEGRGPQIRRRSRLAALIYQGDACCFRVRCERRAAETTFEIRRHVPRFKWRMSVLESRRISSIDRFARRTAMKITPGKQKGMKAVSDSRGVIAAAAMDQRGSLRSAIAKERGVDKKEVTDQMLSEFKTCVTRVLTPHASAILLDPEFGLDAAKARAKNAGLLLAYENSGYDNTRPGRLPDLLDIWSVRRLVAAGADCIKILLYYNPFDSANINDIKHAWVERIGSECTAEDVPFFFLEFVTYEDGKDEKRSSTRARNPISSWVWAA